VGDGVAQGDPATHAVAEQEDRQLWVDVALGEHEPVQVGDGPVEADQSGASR
jgi:hypothetical protein